MNKDNVDINLYIKEYLNERNKSFSFETILDYARKKQVLKSLNKYSHEHILEVGCGLDPLFQYCNEYKSYTIVEPSDEFAQNAKTCAEGKDNIIVISGYMEEVYERLLEQQAFDYIIVSSLLHEVPNPTKLLQSVRKVCIPDTIVHINVPNMYSFHRLLAYEMGLIKNIFEKSETEIKFQRHTNFDKSTLFELVSKNGFQILSYGTYFIKPFNNEQMEKLINQKIVDKKIIQGLEEIAKYMPDLGCEIFVEAKIESSNP